MLLPDIIVRRKTEYVVDMDQVAFCDLYVPTMQGSEGERIRQCAQANGWQEGVDYAMGHRMIFLTYPAWKMVEDVIRSAEKEAKKAISGEDDESVLPDDDAATEYTQREGSLHPGQGYYGGSEDNLLLTRTGTNGTNSLHGGFDGFDRRNWTLVDYSTSYISFALVDINGTEGFPGTVVTTVCTPFQGQCRLCASVLMRSCR